MSDSDSTFVGLNVPEAVYDCLRLQSHFQRVGKTVILGGIITQYLDDNDWSVDTLTERYAKNLYLQWDTRWRDSTSFDDYIEQQRKVMRGTFKLPERLITKIIDKCKEQHPKSTKK